MSLLEVPVITTESSFKTARSRKLTVMFSDLSSGASLLFRPTVRSHSKVPSSPLSLATKPFLTLLATATVPARKMFPWLSSAIPLNVSLGVEIV